MMPTGKCPKCERPVERLLIARVEAGTDMGGPAYRAITLQCPACHSVLGAQLERMFDDAGIQPRGVNEEQGKTSH
jgi:hypothetical protein